MDRWEKLTTLARLAPDRPVEVARRIAHILEVQADRLRFARGRYSGISFEEWLPGLEEAFGADFDRAELGALDAMLDEQIKKLPDHQPITLRHCPGRVLAHTAYAVCRMRRPARVVETGVAYGVTTFGPLLRDAGEGHIINTASEAGLVTSAVLGMYSATKHAVVAVLPPMFSVAARRAPPTW